MMRLRVSPYPRPVNALVAMGGILVGIYWGWVATLGLLQLAQGQPPTDWFPPQTYACWYAAWWIGALAGLLPTPKQAWIAAACGSGLAAALGSLLSEWLTGLGTGAVIFVVGLSVLSAGCIGLSGCWFTSGVRGMAGVASGLTAKIRLARLAGSGQRHKLLEAVARRLTGMALAIGGPKRSWRAEEFLADLTRHGTDGDSPGGWAQLRHAAGLIRGSLRLRVGDACAPLWRLADWALAKPRTERIATLTVMTAVYFWCSSGFSGLMQQLVNVAAVASVIAPALWLRREREIPPVQRRTGNVTSEASTDDVVGPSCTEQATRQDPKPKTASK